MFGTEFVCSGWFCWFPASIRIELLPSLDGDHPDGPLAYWTTAAMLRRTSSCSNAIVIGDAVQWPTTRPTRMGWDRRPKQVPFLLFARSTSALDWEIPAGHKVSAYYFNFLPLHPSFFKHSIVRFWESECLSDLFMPSVGMQRCLRKP